MKRTASALALYVRHEVHKRLRVTDVVNVVAEYAEPDAAERADQLFVAYCDFLQAELARFPLIRSHRQIGALHNLWESATSVQEDFPLVWAPEREYFQIAGPYSVLEEHAEKLFRIEHMDAPPECDCLVCQGNRARNAGPTAHEEWVFKLQQEIPEQCRYSFEARHAWMACPCTRCQTGAPAPGPSSIRPSGGTRRRERNHG